ncbi:MAG: group 1 truncated hemoglobin [bacterium]|nr:group 1 truncated hemoglobin [bacterium]
MRNHTHRTTSLRARAVLGATLWLALSTFVTGCAEIPQLDRRPLYVQLGGVEGVDRVADRFVRELATDPNTRPHFEGIDARRFRSQIAAHLCEIADGPCTYDGDSMLEVHRGMEIDQRAFNATVECLIRAMESLRVPVPAQNRLLARLAPMHADIVTSRAKARYPTLDAPASSE